MQTELLELLERCTFPVSGTAVTCAVSGGADSLALLVLAVSAGCDVTAIHVDHGLRPGSAAEAEVVHRTAERFGAKFEARSVVVEPGPNVEARARAARYGVLPPDVLTGHTADDQVETILLNLIRGAGLDGLSGMRPAGHPILRLRRSETRALCERLEITPVQDPSNDDISILRNRVRHELIPMLNRIASRDVVSVIARQADRLRADAEYLDVLASTVDAQDAAAVAAAPLPLATRALRSWLRGNIDDECHPPSSASIERVLAVANNDVVACEVEGGGRVARTEGRLRFELPEPR